jgi:hypothetical protein
MQSALRGFVSTSMYVATNLIVQFVQWFHSCVVCTPLEFYDQYLHKELRYENHHTTDYELFFKHFLPHCTYLVLLFAISGGYHVPPMLPSVTVLIYI